MAKQAGGDTTSIIITVAIALLLGVILVGIIADNTVQTTQKKTSSETINIAAGRLADGVVNATYHWHANELLTYPAGNSWKSDWSDCAITSFNFTNQSGLQLISGVDYTWVTDGNGKLGNLTLINTEALNTSNSNTTRIVYSYCPSGYQTQSWSRTVTNMVPGFFALGVLLIGAFVIWVILRREGVDI